MKISAETFLKNHKLRSSDIDTDDLLRIYRGYDSLVLKERRKLSG